MYGRRRTPSARPSLLVFRLTYSTDMLISCVVPDPSQWFFHFGEEIIGYTTVDVPESHIVSDARGPLTAAAVCLLALS